MHRQQPQSARAPRDGTENKSGDTNQEWRAATLTSPRLLIVDPALRNRAAFANAPQTQERQPKALPKRPEKPMKASSRPSASRAQSSLPHQCISQVEKQENRISDEEILKNFGALVLFAQNDTGSILDLTLSGDAFADATAAPNLDKFDVEIDPTLDGIRKPSLEKQIVSTETRLMHIWRLLLQGGAHKKLKIDTTMQN